MTNKKERIFRGLYADEIEVRVGNVTEHGATLLLYKDARCDMNVLDDTYGPENWQRDHKEVKGNMYGGVAIWNNDLKEWIWKWDCGTESNTEQQKGEASDAFKRACFNLGIGRELYTAPFIFVKCPTKVIDPTAKYKKYKLVSPYQFSGCSIGMIQYDESGSRRKIRTATVLDRNSSQIWPTSKNAIDKPVDEPKEEPTEEFKPVPINKTQLQFVRTKIKALEINEMAMCESYGINSVESMLTDTFATFVHHVQVKEAQIKKAQQELGKQDDLGL